MKRRLSVALAVLLLTMCFSGCVKTPAETGSDGNNQGTESGIVQSSKLGQQNANVLSETEAVELAKKECTISYDTVKANLNSAAGVWEINFSTSYLVGGDQTIWIDLQGKILEIVYGE